MHTEGCYAEIPQQLLYQLSHLQRQSTLVEQGPIPSQARLDAQEMHNHSIPTNHANISNMPRPAFHNAALPSTQESGKVAILLLAAVPPPTKPATAPSGLCRPVGLVCSIVGGCLGHIGVCATVDSCLDCVLQARGAEVKQGGSRQGQCHWRVWWHSKRSSANGNPHQSEASCQFVRVCAGCDRRPLGLGKALSSAPATGRTGVGEVSLGFWLTSGLQSCSAKRRGLEPPKAARYQPTCGNHCSMLQQVPVC